MKPKHTLPARQAQALQLLALDLSVDEIAERMCIKPSGVRKHIERVHRNMRVRTSIAAYRLALLQRLIELHTTD